MENFIEKYDNNDFKFYDFQLKAIQWMIYLFNNYDKIDNNDKIMGGILQMDMGMGKTEIGLEWCKNYDNENILIVCPCSLINHWKKRIKNKRLNIQCISFNDYREKEIILINKKKIIIILDEAHFAKNNDSLLYNKLIYDFKNNKIKFLWLLTGTIFMNDKSDVENLFSLMKPFKELSKKSFEYDKISKNCLFKLQWNDIQEIQLPKLIIKIQEIEFTSLNHKFIYDLCKKWINNHNNSNSLVYVEYLQRIGNHAYYIGKEEWWSKNIIKILNENKKRKQIDLTFEDDKHFIFENDSNKMINTIINNNDNFNDNDKLEFEIKMNYGDLFFSSNKFQFVFNLININKNDKIIIFSRYIWTLKWLEYYLKWRGINSKRIDGSMEINKRNKKIETFSKSLKSKILLCSLQTCGYGLDFTFSSKVIMMEPYWNEPTEKQAYTRIHRIGQKKDCIVYQLILKDSIDELIHSRSIEKTLSEKDLLLSNFSLE